MFIDAVLQAAGASLGAVNWVACLAMLAAAVLAAREKPLRRRVVVSLLAAYVMCVLTSTVLNREVCVEMHAQLVPLWSYWRGFAEGQTGLVAEIFLNVMLTVPLGFLLQELRPRSAAVRVALWAAAFELSIEVLQLVGCRGLFEWDDVLNGVLGALLGRALWLAAARGSRACD